VAAVGAVRRLAIESSLAPAAVLQALASQAAGLTGAAIPAELRAVRITGVRLRLRGRRFAIRFARRRRALAALVCKGRVVPATNGSHIEATIRPSRAWMAVPAAGSLLLALAWLISAMPPDTTLRYALLVGVLWALNIGLAMVPIGTDPPAEEAAYVALLEGASR
jgi:hypothetical protein